MLAAEVVIPNGAITVILAALPIAGAIIIAAMANRKQVNDVAKEQATTLQSIELKVDGRLEKALEKIDALQAHLQRVTGVDAPPMVAGLNVPAGKSEAALDPATATDADKAEAKE